MLRGNRVGGEAKKSLLIACEIVWHLLGIKIVLHGRKKIERILKYLSRSGGY